MINLQKLVGETPLMALERLRILRPDLAKERLSYAGRLDPLAYGVLPIMVGTDNDNRDEYLYLPKTYEVDILFGIDTDTHDMLGIVKSAEPIVIKEVAIQKALTSFTGTFLQAYPAFSSKTVKGIPLFMLTRQGETVELPTHEVFVKKIDFIKTFEINSEQLLQSAKNAIASVKGDFRQEEILKSWDSRVASKVGKYVSVTLTIEASSGFYVRALARDMGKLFGVGAIATRIFRTRVGQMKVEDSIS